MKKKRIVIALGHEALGSTLPEQQKAAARTAKAVADFIREDYQVVITHSNGPQVGMIHTAMNEFCRLYPEYTATPTSVCSAMSQGYIGYDLQNAIRTELLNRGIYKTVSTVLTQVVVDPYDEAFYHPTKVIGRVMTKEEAEEEEKKGNHVTEVEGGYRRIVASPKPMDIVEIDAFPHCLMPIRLSLPVAEAEFRFWHRTTACREPVLSLRRILQLESLQNFWMRICW